MDGQSTKLCVYKIKYLYDMIKIQTTVDPYCDLFRLFHLLFLNTNFKVTFSALQLDAVICISYRSVIYNQFQYMWLSRSVHVIGSGLVAFCI